MDAFDIGLALTAICGFGALLVLGLVFVPESRERAKDARRRNPVPQYREGWWRG